MTIELTSEVTDQSGTQGCNKEEKWVVKSEITSCKRQLWDRGLKVVTESLETGQCRFSAPWRVGGEKTIRQVTQ